MELAIYDYIIASSAILILSFFFSEIARRTNVPSVLMLIILGIVLKFGLDAVGLTLPASTQVILKFLFKQTKRLRFIPSKHQKFGKI